MNKKYLAIIIGVLVIISAIAAIIITNKPSDIDKDTKDTKDTNVNDLNNSETYVTSPIIEREKIESGELEVEVPDWHVPPEEDPFMEEPGSYKEDDPDMITVDEDAEVYEEDPFEYNGEILNEEDIDIKGLYEELLKKGVGNND